MTDTTHQDTFEAGMRTRREVLGDQYVDAALAKTTEFSAPMQQFVTEYCWGTVWNRDGLPRATRSLLNIAMLTAMNRNHELATHVRGAVRNDVTPGEIREVLMQAAVYVGVPAALESFRVAQGVLTEMGQDA